VSVGAWQVLHLCPACGADVLHPLQRLAEAHQKAYETIQELARQHQRGCEMFGDLRDLAPEDAQRAYELLMRSKRLIERFAREVIRQVKTSESLADKIWADQMRRWIDGLDEELRQLRPPS
jgi:hypothetical protein